jgi:hypothetical protein
MLKALLSKIGISAFIAENGQVAVGHDIARQGSVRHCLHGQPNACDGEYCQ